MIHYIIQVSRNYNSSAGYNRVRLFVKGFEEKGVQVKLHKLIISSNYNVFQKIFFLIKNTIYLFNIAMSVGKGDVVVIYGETYFTYLYKLFSRKTNLVIERTEFPAYIINVNISRRGYKNSLKNIDGLKYARMLITCSSTLRYYYSQYVKDILISPLIVDISEFEEKMEVHENNNVGEYIAYCGNFDNNKDGIPNLIESFAIVKKKIPSLKLVLIGSGKKSVLENLYSQLKDKNIETDVIFTGLLPHNKVIDWLCGAKILALARPNTKQAEGGIPSKVGEYLSSGVPCVITRVGDLPMYLNDTIDCFLSDPDSPEKFAEKLLECYNSDNKKVIGENAKKIARQFNYLNQVNVVYSEFKSKFNV